MFYLIIINLIFLFICEKQISPYKFSLKRGKFKEFLFFVFPIFMSRFSNFFLLSSLDNFESLETNKT